MNYPQTITLKTDVMYLDCYEVDFAETFGGAVVAPAREFDRTMDQMVNFLWSGVTNIPAGTVFKRNDGFRAYYTDNDEYEHVALDLSELPEGSYE